MLLTNFFGHDLDMSKAQRIWTVHHAILLLCALITIIGALYFALKIKASKNEKKIKYIFMFLLIFLKL